jgi:DNA-binding beta-propeller fold protein YncE
MCIRDSFYTEYITVQAVLDHYGTPLSELMYIDIDLGCTAIPGTPIDLTATQGAGIELNWIDKSTIETSYDIQRSESSDSGFATISNQPVDTQTYTDSTGIFGTTYYYRVKALKTGGISSAYSNVASAIAPNTWNVSGASFVQSFDVSAKETQPEDVVFKPDGLKMYIVGTTGSDSVNEYDLSVAWDISTSVWNQAFVVNNVPLGIAFKSDGTKMYVCKGSGSIVVEYDLSVAWDISTSVINANSISFQAVGISFKSDGTKVFLADQTGDQVKEYTLSSAWDISTSAFVQNFDISAKEDVMTGLTFSVDGDRMLSLIHI